MTWFKIDDGFYDHPKVEDLEPSAVGLWTLCGTYAARHLTDGHVARARVRRFGGTDDDVAALVEAGLWHEVEGGYQFHDWEEHQPTRAEVEEKREAERLRKAKQRRRNDGRFTAEKDLPQEGQGVLPVSHRDTPRDTPRDSGRNPSGVTPSRPDPTRPDLEVPEGTSAKTTRKAPAKPLPADWAPTETHVAKATERGLDLAREAEAFKLHAEANDRRAANWNAAFSMWLTKANPRPQQYTPARSAAGSPGAWMNLSSSRSR